MHDARGVRLGQTLGGLMGDIGQLPHGQTACDEEVAQGHALHPFHRDERHAGLLADVVDGQDVRMIQRGGGLRFLLEPAETIGIAGHVARKDLDGNRAIEPRVARAVHLAHAPRTDGLGDFIRAKTRTWGERHRADGIRRPSSRLFASLR